MGKTRLKRSDLPFGGMHGQVTSSSQMGFAMIHDTPGPSPYRHLRIWKRAGLGPSKMVVVSTMPHPGPTSDQQPHALIRTLHRPGGEPLFDVGDGVCHQLLSKGASFSRDLQGGESHHARTAPSTCCLRIGPPHERGQLTKALAPRPGTMKVNIRDRWRRGHAPRTLCSISSEK